MNKINLNLDKNKKYVVACSFGPDSMALLSSAIENGYKIVVAHVNYRKREAAVFEQKSLERYCEENKVKIFVLDLINKKHTGNFQNWAREQRYKFFKKVAIEEETDAVLVAHQQDDVIETFLMQEKRGNITKNPGISRENELFGVKIIRPLLEYSKQDLKEFDDKNGVPYSIDESNLKNAYERNRIRHEIVEKMAENERHAILKKIHSKTCLEVVFKTIWTVDEFANLRYEQIVKLLDHFMSRTNTHRDLSRKFVNEMQKAFKANGNCLFELTDKIRLEKDYGAIYIVNVERLGNYKYSFVETLKNEIFDIDFSSGAEDRNISLNKKHLTVKNIDINNKLIINDYSTSINRLFIDWKMPHYLRDVWPGIYDEENNLLYVPRYRKDFTDNHKSKFVFRTNYFTEF